MSLSKFFRILFDIKNAILEKTEDLSDRVIFYAKPFKRDRLCSACGSHQVHIKQSKQRTLRGCNLGFKKSYLKIITYKFFCTKCHKSLWMQLPFVMGKLPYTKSFIRFILALVGVSTIIHVAQLCGIQWKTVKNLHKAELKLRPKQFSYKKLKYVSIDEIAIRKGHHYMTIFTDISSGKIIFATEGRKEEYIRGFLKKLAQRARRLEGIAMDMSAGYAAAVRNYLPHVAIIFDHFHVTKLLNKAVDEVRKQEWAKHQARGMDIGKGDRFLLFHNFEDLQGDQQTALNNLLNMNQNLSIMHTMKEQFRAFWKQDHYLDGFQFLMCWITLAEMSGVKPLMKVAKTLMRHADGLLNYFLHRISNGKAEGINNKIKVMKRKSYGCRDIGYFILKLYNLHKVTCELVG